MAPFKTYKTRMSQEIVVDLDPQECSKFGFLAGQIVDIMTKGLAYVVGVAEGDLWFYLEMDYGISRYKGFTKEHFKRYNFHVTEKEFRFQQPHSLQKIAHEYITDNLDQFKGEYHKLPKSLRIEVLVVKFNRDMFGEEVIHVNSPENQRCINNYKACKQFIRDDDDGMSSVIINGADRRSYVIRDVYDDHGDPSVDTENQSSIVWFRMVVNLSPHFEWRVSRPPKSFQETCPYI
jgi:hypothetical protein